MTGDQPSQVDYVELVAAILLGIGAVAIAWSTYQAPLWGGIHDEGYTESIREASNAVDLLQAADRISALDQANDHPPDVAGPHRHRPGG